MLSRTNVDKKAAVHHLQKAYDNPKSNAELTYLGKAYMLNLEFDNAKLYLDQYLEKPGKYLVEAALLRANCDQAIEIMKNPINISFENMGKRINGEYPDYNPFVTKDERVFLYIKKRNRKGILNSMGITLQTFTRFGLTGEIFQEQRISVRLTPHWMRKL